ncbi:TPA: hypothetical protein N0F65_003610 [Lagenidium giganteum]|uniref:Uncharacterized protein n=1 Tax=Lagenidium giganteum TaxID=4803 RepID=A0AAV2Z2R3_9STRA|nr:TPA: hypothetical protein N0F65_003610 [Lagenidium giganteum]
MDGSSSSWMEETSYVDGDEEEDFEVEDAVDNEPMHVVEKLYLGSIDAAMNTAALTRCRIAHVLALLGATDAQDCAVVPTGDGDSSAAPVGGADVCIKRTQIAMEDSHEEPLLLRLPSVLEQLELALYV